MTATITGLPDRYRPLDEVGPEERTDTGVIHCWRAKDRILNRDVAIRVHVPGGPAARGWIARALTAGGLATPALAMVYDASEGSGGESGVAYVVNEWIEGQTLAERLRSGPMGEREARTVLRRLAEGVAEAHRVGLAVGGLSPETVVLRPNGLVGLRAVPAATGTVQEDITALGALLEYCLTGRRAGVPGPDGVPAREPVIGAPDLAALVRRTRSTGPGAGLASAAAMAALLAERPRSHASVPVRGRDESDSGWLRRLRDHRDDDRDDDRDDHRDDHRDDDRDDDRDDAAHEAPAVAEVPDEDPQRLDPHTLPPVPPGRARGVPPVPASPAYADDDVFGGADDDEDEQDRPGRRRLVVGGLLLAAVALVVLLAWWVGTNLLSVAGDVDERPGTTPSVAASSAPPAEDSAAPSSDAGPLVAITGASVFDPFGDGEPENDDEVPATYDGDPASTWSTLNYRGSADFGNLKPGVGIVYDLGSDQAVGGVTLTTTTPGIAVEVRTGGAPDGDLDSFTVAAAGSVDGTTDLAFEEPVTARYVLVWVTGLVPAEDGFSGDIAEVGITPAS
ncbi:serine/threonine protein kinase [Geodermatophilus normandii]|uniref:Serine/threonine protein kinase n=1 Tax=Geodermatophilus normandii TaxID=1137989 RepID=A0A317QIX0_9ACTN|nr:protein kinase family protein [Geodermatophilus normandii]PWW22195.1 serine/threonine protein kinase [Geodermatophilus normandii]